MSNSAYKSTNHVRTIVAVGVFAAFAYIACVLFHFKAGFLSFDLKDAVMAIGAMLFGPIYGLAMSLIVSTIELVTISGTGVYGFIMNVISSSTFVCVGSLIYSKKRSLNGALIGMTSSVVATVAVMMVANLLITPFYMSVTVKDVVGLIPTLLLPFNLTKALFNSSLVFVLYKPVTTAIQRAGFKSGSGVADSSNNSAKMKFNPAITVAAVLIGVLCLVFFFMKLNGDFTFGYLPKK